jgi:hypothetical protein
MLDILEYDQVYIMSDYSYNQMKSSTIESIDYH